MTSRTRLKRKLVESTMAEVREHPDKWLDVLIGEFEDRLRRMSLEEIEENYGKIK